MESVVVIMKKVLFWVLMILACAVLPDGTEIEIDCDFDDLIKLLEK